MDENTDIFIKTIMDTIITIEEDEQQQLNLPLLPEPEADPPKPKSPAQKAIRKTFKGSAKLANLLPTGSVLAFQVLSPILTHDGNCSSSDHLTAILLLSLCAASCFILCFTDSVRDERGKVRHALATPRGLWVIDDEGWEVPPEVASARRIRTVDVVHAVLAVMVFGSVAMFDQNVVSCLFPRPSKEERKMLIVVPMAIGAVCSALFVKFPSKRHGVGFPLSKH